MDVCEARMCSSLCPAKVPLQTSAEDRGDLQWNRNQHLIKTTLPTSAYYISPKDYAEDPTLPKPPNFVGQFTCMRLRYWLRPCRLTQECIQQGLEPTTPLRISASGQVSFKWSGFGYALMKYFVHTALDFREWLGEEVKINEYCRDLAIRGGKRLSEILGTEEMDETPNHELTLNMVRNRLTRLRVVLNIIVRLM